MFRPTDELAESNNIVDPPKSPESLNWNEVNGVSGVPPPPVIVTVTLSVVGSVIVAPTKLIDSTFVVIEEPLSKI